MPPLVVDDTVRCSIIWALSGTEYAVNVLHYFVGGSVGIGQATADAFAAQVGADMVASNLDDNVASTVTMARCTVRDLRMANQPEFSATDPQPGLEGAHILPLANSIVVTLRTALAGRRYRGRVYLPGFSENQNTAAGVIDPAAITAAEAFIQALTIITIEGNEWQLGVMTQATDPPEINPVISSGVRDNIWDIQRRRNYPGI